MNGLRCLPGAYFASTRLRNGYLAFHVAFEWAPALLLAALFGRYAPLSSMGLALLAYLAFISVYEIGYIVNDRYSALRETDGRVRGSQTAGPLTIAAWIAIRLGCFLAATYAIGAWHSPAWWGFFLSLAAVFAFHNLVTDREIRTFSFVWLAWLRFMAPVFWIIEPTQLFGIGTGNALVYVIFRELAYLDSKALLAMPGRQRPNVRLTAFVLPVLALPAVCTQPSGRGLALLIVWFAAVALAGRALGLPRDGA